MPTPRTAIEDMQFLLRRVLVLDGIGAGGAADLDAWTAALLAIDDFARGELLALNGPGDQQGCRHANGRVRAPDGFVEAYRQFRDGGWTRLSAPAEWGGLALPQVLQSFVDEIVASANLSFALYAGLVRSAAETLLAHGSDDLKAAYLPRLVSGEWAGTMCLTEPQAGSDVGLLTTRARPAEDGGYRLDGTKIFITGGDHDLTDNIVHLVLARLPDAPPGIKGISLFLVPKILPDGQVNGVVCPSIERKMGIHGAPTCVLSFENAQGWLVGAPNAGMSAIFTMMNAERLFVGVQGQAVGEAAFQAASRYAEQRIQGRGADGSERRVAIAEHPDVRRMLLTARVLTEGSRALAAWVSVELDRSRHHPDESRRRQAEDFVALLTPVVKASGTDFGLESAIVSQQVFGGHGYINDWGIEQLVRDVRITSIYEGTNGIQALDLTGRKLRQDGGRLPRAYFAQVRSAAADLPGEPPQHPLRDELLAALAALETATAWIAGAPPARVAAIAGDYLQLFALVAHGHMWALMLRVAAASRDPAGRDKSQLARIFAIRLLSRWRSLTVSIAAADQLAA